MNEKIRNTLNITVDGADFLSAHKIVFWLRQGPIFFEYTPFVVSATEIFVNIPKADADKLRHDIPARLQTVYTDNNGNDIPSGIVNVSVNELLNPEGYDGN